MKNLHIPQALQCIQQMSNKGNLKFAYALKKNEKYLSSEINIVRSMLPEEPEQYNRYKKDIRKLAEGINKDSSIASEDRQVEFEKLVAAYNEDHKEQAEAIDAYNKMVEEIDNMEYEGKIYKIKWEWLPEDTTKAQLDAIEFLVEFPDDWEEKEDLEGKETEEKV